MLMKLEFGPASRDSGWPHNGFRSLSLLNQTARIVHAMKEKEDQSAVSFTLL